MDKRKTLAQTRMQVMRRQAKVIVIQWVTILVLFITIFVLAFQLSKANAAAPDPTELPTVTAQLKPAGPNDYVESDRMVLYESMPPATPEAAETPESSPEPCPITYEEIDMLAKTLYRECGGLSWRGTQYGVSYKARQAAVAWCALNRISLPEYPDTLSAVLTYPNAFAYDASAPVTDELRALTEDVVSRWWAEQQGEQDVGRTLPATYTFFYGDGKENHFRDAYSAPYNTWDWSLPDPYMEDSYDD